MLAGEVTSTFSITSYRIVNLNKCSPLLVIPRANFSNWTDFLGRFLSSTSLCHSSGYFSRPYILYWKLVWKAVGNKLVHTWMLPCLTLFIFNQCTCGHLHSPANVCWLQNAVDVRLVEYESVSKYPTMTDIKQIAIIPNRHSQFPTSGLLRFCM